MLHNIITLYNVSEDKLFTTVIHFGENISENVGLIAASKGNQLLGLIRRNITYKGPLNTLPVLEINSTFYGTFCVPVHVNSRIDFRV